ncbi:protease, partial [Streptomyces varsoviensis]
MHFHPQPRPGAATPWAFPAPERDQLPNGLTLLHCHRPGQQVVAVEVNLQAPLEAEPAGLDGVATIMARALSEGTDKHSAEEFAAELERCGATLDAHADHPGVRVSLEVPASRLPKALALLADALRAPAFADSEIERLVGNRLDEIPHELANPARRAAMALSKQLFPADARMSRPRQGTEETVRNIDAAAVRAFYEAHVRPATATAVVVGDFTGVDLAQD